MLLQQHPLLLAAFGMDVETVKQEIEKAMALEKLKVQWEFILKKYILWWYVYFIGGYRWREGSNW